VRLLLEDQSLADELVLFLAEAGFAVDPGGVLPTLAADAHAHSTLAHCLSDWNARHPEAPAWIEPAAPGCTA
jgi:hypothetical protein